MPDFTEFDYDQAGAQLNLQITDYKELLLSKYEEIRAKESKYSFRRFAKDIGVSPSNLSDIFKGRCGLSATGATKIAEALKFSEGDRLFFIDLVECRHARNKAEREAAQRRLEKRLQKPFQVVATEAEMSVVDHWYYLAALELFDVVPGPVDAEMISKRIGITLDEANKALTTLTQLRMIKRDGDTYVREKHEVAIETPVPSRAVRSFHQQVLDLAKQALEKQPMEKREYSSLLMSFDSKRIEEARAFLSEMENEFFRRFEAKPGEGDSVYVCNQQFFRIDQEQK